METAVVVPERVYGCSKCFGCQDCLLCGTVCLYDICSCKADQKPITKQRRKGKVKTAQKRLFSLPPTSPDDHKPCLTSPAQVEFLKACNDKFGYQILFTSDFEFYFCSTCNSRFQKAKKIESSLQEPLTSFESQPYVEITTSLQEPLTSFESHPYDEHTTSSLQEPFTVESNSSCDELATATSSLQNSVFQSHSSSDSMQNSSLLKSSSFMSVEESLDSTPLHLQLVVKKGDGANLPMKRVKISAQDFLSFECQVEDHVQNICASTLGSSKNIILSLSYKPSNSRSLETSLADSDDFKIFLDECKKLTNSEKNMMVIATLKQQEIKKKKHANKKRVKGVLDTVCYSFMVVFFFH